jgi:putative hydrolase of the HAD superfamily
VAAWIDLALARSLGHFPPVPRVLLFDLDDTLFSRAVAFHRWAAPISRGQEDLDWLVDADARGRAPRHEFALKTVARFGLGDAAPERARLFAEAFPAQLAACVVPEPGVREVLVRLAAVRRVGIVTNGSGATQREKLWRAGLADLFDTIIISGELGIEKPAPQIFLHAAALCGVPPHECAFIGDDPDNDIAPATALGMTAVWRMRDAWPPHLPPPRYAIRSFAELEALA